MLNKKLYRALVRKFGAENVKVVREDQPFKGKYVEDFHEERGTVLRMRRATSGEEYQIRCPVCRDWKPRLSISHLWGVKDRVTDSRNWWLIQCWNEDCFRDYTTRRNFYDELTQDMFIGGQENESAGPVHKPKERGKPQLPGKLWRVDQLAEKSKKHPAIVYMQRRLLDPVQLGQQFGVGFCPDPWTAAAVNRLIAPVRMDGKLLGWSGRWLGDVPDKETPKWYHDPNMVKSELLYNYDAAAACHTKVLVEGPGDVWGVGKAGMAVLGKTLSPTQITLLQKCCLEDSAVVVMFDSGMSEKERSKGKPHHIEKAFSLLQENSRFRGRILRVYTSPEIDPGDSDRGYLHGLIRYVAEREGVRVVLPEE